jgi:copper(I)-binding protein
MIRDRVPAWVRAAGATAAALCGGLAAAQVTVVDPWVRGTVQGQTSTAAYMTLRSAAGVRLVSVTSPVAGRCSLHQMTMSGSVMRMRTLDALPIPAAGSVALQEGHDHLMLEGLKRPLGEGDTVELTLTFVDAQGRRQAVDVKAPVRPLGARP